MIPHEALAAIAPSKAARAPFWPPPVATLAANVKVSTTIKAETSCVRLSFGLRLPTRGIRVFSGNRLYRPVN
jgi:hypothetical protein